jgi:type VI secretion system protein ImpL
MKTLQQLVLSLDPIPVWLVVILALLVVAGSLYLVWQLVKVTARRASSAKRAGVEAPTYLAQSMRQSFVASDKALGATFPGSDYAYRLPVYLLMGESASGKSSLLRHSGLKPVHGTVSGNTPVNWVFYTSAAMVEVRGDCLIGPLGEKRWDEIIRLFQRYRPERPLDGVVMTIPMSDFVGPNAMSQEQAAERAEDLHRRLGRLQTQIGMQLPIYVVLTKCDVLQGFQDAQALLPAWLSDETLGWSSPYTPGSQFSPHWIGEAVDHIAGILEDAVVEALAEKGGNGHESAYLLPGALRGTEAQLAVFLSTLLRVSNYNGSTLLRGLYLTGSAAETAAAGHAPGRLSGAAANAGELQAHPVFVRGLLEKKVFPEFSLGRIFSLAMLSTNRNVRIAQLGVAAMVVIAVFGLWNNDSYLNKLSQQLQGVTRAVQQIDEVVERQRQRADGGLNDATRREAFDVLIRVGQAGEADLRPLTVPASWVSPLPGRIESLIGLAWDRILFDTLHNGLLQRLRSAVNVPQEAFRFTDGPESVPRPYPDYKAIQVYLQQIIELEGHVKAFNDLENSADALVVQSLVAYLLGGELPRDLLPQISDSLRDHKQDLNIISIDPFKQNAETSVLGFYDAFLSDVTRRHGLEADLTRLAQLIDSEPRQQVITRADSSRLSEIRELVGRLDSLLNAGVYDWAAHRQFDPDGRFQASLAAVEVSELLGRSVALALGDRAAFHHEQFRRALQQVRSTRLGPLITMVDDGTVRLAQPVRELALRLANFSDLPQGDSALAEVSIPQHGGPGDYVVWDIPTLDRAMAQANEFQQKFGLMPGGGGPAPGNAAQPIDATLRGLARGDLTKALVSQIAHAILIQRVPASQQSVGQEAFLRSRVGNFAEASGRVLRLMEALEGLGASEPFGRLRALAATESREILRSVDDLLARSTAYQPRGGSFDWWQGEPGLAFAAFNARDTLELSNYLTFQRERLAVLSRNYADPALAFLLSTTLDVGAGDLDRLTRWQVILESLDQYDAKVADNPVSRLERFIGQTLATVTPRNCSAALVEGRNARSANFFLSRQAELAEALAAQCNALSSGSLISDYQGLEKAFNQTLAGVPPFRATPPNTATEGASLTTINAVLARYDNFMNSGGGDPVERGSTGGSLDVIDPFLRRLGDVQRFLDATKAEGGKMEVQVDVEFRVNRTAEFAGNQIIDWVVAIGDDRMTQFDGGKRLVWSPGKPIEVSFRWALNAPTTPVLTGDSVKAMSVEGGTVRFRYEDPWALVTMLRAHGGMAGPARFEVPISPPAGAAGQTAGAVQKAIIFNSFRLYGSAQRGAHALALPDFPERAPVLADGAG